MRHFNSIYGTHIVGFISMKRTLGFKYGKEEIILSLFDRLAFERKESEPGITKALAEAWSKKKGNETESYRYSRICLLCQLSSYMNDLGFSSYIPKQIPFPKNTFIPYIYSPKEIYAIFTAADSLAPRLTFLNSTIFSIPTLLRLLYGTGLRISEALALKENDVNLEGNYLCVRDSKNGKERIIPFSNTLSLVLKDYLFYKDQLPVKLNQSNIFFVKLNGEAVKYTSCLGRWFNMCLDEAGIIYTDKSRKPRIHDLRHNKYSFPLITSNLRNNLHQQVTIKKRATCVDLLYYSTILKEQLIMCKDRN